MTTMVVPAEERGWEVWESGKSGLEKAREVEGDLKDGGLNDDVCLALPVRTVATLPVVVQSRDTELCRGAAHLALERAGLLGDEDSETWDAVVVNEEDGASLVAGHALLEDLFAESEELKDVELDYSPRCFEVGLEEVIVCWREQGRWALVCYKSGKPIYAEPMGADLDRGLLAAVQQLKGQLMLADIDFEPERLVLWSEVGRVQEKEWEAGLGIPVEFREKPEPRFAEKSLAIRSHGMVEWERKKKAGSKNKLWLVLIALMYLGAGGFIYLKLSSVNEKIEEQREIISATEGVSAASQMHTEKWEELDDLVKERWPLEVYKECKLLIPPNSSMRFTQFEVFANDRIELRGYAPGLTAINAYIQKLRSAEAFSDMEWTTPAPVENTKTKQWEFNFEAEKEVF